MPRRLGASTGPRAAEDGDVGDGRAGVGVDQLEHRGVAARGAEAREPLSETGARHDHRGRPLALAGRRSGPGPWRPRRGPSRARRPASAVAGRSAATSTSSSASAPDWVDLDLTRDGRVGARDGHRRPRRSGCSGRSGWRQVEPGRASAGRSRVHGVAAAPGPGPRSSGAGSRTASTAVRLRRARSPRATRSGGGSAARRPRVGLAAHASAPLSAPAARRRRAQHQHDHDRDALQHQQRDPQPRASARRAASSSTGRLTCQARVERSSALAWSRPPDASSPAATAPSAGDGQHDVLDAAAGQLGDHGRARPGGQRLDVARRTRRRRAWRRGSRPRRW